MNNNLPKSPEGALKELLEQVAVSFMNIMAPQIREIVREELLAKQSNDQQEKIFTKAELSKLLSVSTVTIDSWERLGRLKSYRIGRRVFFKNADIQASMQTLKKYNHTI